MECVKPFAQWTIELVWIVVWSCLGMWCEVLFKNNLYLNMGLVVDRDNFALFYYCLYNLNCIVAKPLLGWFDTHWVLGNVR